MEVKKSQELSVCFFLTKKIRGEFEASPEFYLCASGSLEVIKMMDLMTVGIFSGCFLVVLSLVWLLSFLTKEQSYEDGLRQQKGGRLAALGVNKSSKEEGGKNRHDKRQAKQQDKPAKAKKQVQQVRQ